MNSKDTSSPKCLKVKQIASFFVAFQSFFYLLNSRGDCSIRMCKKTDLQKLAILRMRRFSKSVRRRFVAVDVKVLRRSRQPQNDPIQLGLHENLAACKTSDKLNEYWSSLSLPASQNMKYERQRQVLRKKIGLNVV